MAITRFILLVLSLLSCPTIAFSSSLTWSKTKHSFILPSFSKTKTTSRKTSTLASASASSIWIDFRGGDSDSASGDAASIIDHSDIETHQQAQQQQPSVHQVLDAIHDQHPPASFLSLVSIPMMSSLTAFGKAYASQLQQRPIMTKSITAGCIFLLSDYLAQALANNKKNKNKNNNKEMTPLTSTSTTTTTTTSSPSSINMTRLLASGLVGLCYFGPAAHAWYEMIFRVFPGTSLISTLQKAMMGQLLFGPSFTCIFFASALLQSNQFTVRNWIRKIKTDLPQAWMAGVGFWPLVDLVAYSMIAPAWIPLFINACSLVWTIYLSTIANQ